MEAYSSQVNSQIHQNRSKVYSSGIEDVKESDSYIESSEVDGHLDIIPLTGAVTIEFSQENLAKMIPAYTMINCIYNSYPDAITETNEIIQDSLIEIIREGAKVNWFESLGEILLKSKFYEELVSKTQIRITHLYLWLNTSFFKY